MVLKIMTGKPEALIPVFMRIFIFLSVCFLFQSPSDSFAQTEIITDVKVIYASSGPKHIDPGLRHIGSELRSVFRYTSYRLIQETRMALLPQSDGKVSLPGRRVLVATPLAIKGKRIKYRIRIMEGGNRVFQTEILLEKNRSITIGGPRHKKGYLLFNISGK